MRSLLLPAILAISMPVAAHAECKALDKFMSKWGMNIGDSIYETTDETTKEPVYVFDLRDRVAADARYAVVWLDPKTCTADVVFRDLPGMLGMMEMSVYDRF